jgi:hypothetical protein
VVVGLDVNLLTYAVEVGSGDVACSIEPIRDLQGMEAFVDEIKTLLQQLSGEYNNTCGSISNLVILGLTQLDEELCSWMLDFL